jgi:hypothetical protein
MAEATVSLDDWNTYRDYRSPTSLLPPVWENRQVVPTTSGRFMAFSLTAAMSVVAAVTGFTSGTVAVPLASASAEAFCQTSPVVLLSSEMLNAWQDMESYRYVEDGWDGRGSVKPSCEAISVAQDFLSLLPFGTPAPEALVSSDGDVGWFWREGDRAISVSFQPHRRIVYFGQKAREPIARGTFALNAGASLPVDLLSALNLA